MDAPSRTARSDGPCLSHTVWADYFAVASPKLE